MTTLWDLKEGRELCRFLSFDDGTNVVVTTWHQSAKREVVIAHVEIMRELLREMISVETLNDSNRDEPRGCRQSGP